MSAEILQSRQNVDFFCYKSAHKSPIPLSDFYKIWRGGRSPRSAPSRQNSPLWLSKRELTGPKFSKSGIFVINFPKEVYHLQRFSQNLAWEGVSCAHPFAKFQRYGFKTWALLPHKSTMIVILVEICP